MDLKLRQLERSGDHVAWLVAAMRAGITYDYDTQLGPPALWDAKCADCETIGLGWSNCSRCSSCHRLLCNFDDGEMQRFAVHLEGGILVVAPNKSCNG